MKYLVIVEDDGGAVDLQEVHWKNPRIIDDFWFGDSPANRKFLANVLPNTAASREAFKEVQEAYDALVLAKARAIDSRLVLSNKKARGELD